MALTTTSGPPDMDSSDTEVAAVDREDASEARLVAETVEVKEACESS